VRGSDDPRPRIRPARARLFRARVGAILHVALIVVAVFAVFAVGFVGAGLYDATTKRTIIVGGFDAPPAPQAQGPGGAPVAQLLVERLRAMRAATPAGPDGGPALTGSDGDIVLEPTQQPKALGRLLHNVERWAGGEVRIDGELVRSGDNVALTVRGNGVLARTFAGTPNTLTALVAGAADHIYLALAPRRFIQYLGANGRAEDAPETIRIALAQTAPAEHPFLLKLWGDSLSGSGRYPEAIEKYREAIRLKPDFWAAYGGQVRAEAANGHEETALLSAVAMEQAARRGSWLAARVPFDVWWSADRARWDLGALHDAAQLGIATGGHPTRVAGRLAEAEVLALMHDVGGARRALEAASAATTDADIARGHFVRALVALDLDDNAGAQAAFQAAAAVFSRDPLSAAAFTAPYCWFARAAERAGDHAQADADIARGGHVVDCYRFKADIADQRNDWGEAQQDYAAAVALAPSLPAGYDSWGKALARHGLLADAIEMFQQANVRGPRWAAPLAHWADALAAQSHFTEAAARYAAAAQYAPNWGALYLHWGRALEKSGDRAGAVVKYRRALDLGLSDADRQGLAACCQ
jgi:tetratricopeptide (TPR) repeat protein